MRTSPSEARITIDGQPAGTSPLELCFGHYGTREVIARLPGHRPARVLAEMRPPLWQLFPLDLVSELLIPWTLQDRHELDIGLEPLTPLDADALQQRGQAMRALEGEP